MASHTESSSDPSPKSDRLYKKGLSPWAKDIIDMALDAGMTVVNYDGVLQPQIFLFPVREWNKPPFMELEGKELFVNVPHNREGHTLHMRLENFFWSIPNPDGSGETITLFFYAPKPREDGE